MNTRIQEIRKDYKLTMQQFGERIGLKTSAVNALEKGTNNATVRVIKSICTEFLVNEEWLLYGKGEKYKEISNYDRIAHLTHDLLHDEPESFRNRFVAMLDDLDIEGWKLLEKMCLKITEEKKED